MSPELLNSGRWKRNLARRRLKMGRSTVSSRLGIEPRGPIWFTFVLLASLVSLRCRSHNEVLFSDDFSQPTLDQWTPLQGDWTVQDGRLLQQDRETVAFISSKTGTWPDYSLSLRAMRPDDALDGFLIVLRYPDRDDAVEWTIGGWYNTASALQRRRGFPTNTSTRYEATVRPCSVETGRWYDIRADVRGDNVKCWLDEELMVDYTDSELGECAPSRIALGTWRTRAFFDDVVVTSGYSRQNHAPKIILFAAVPDDSVVTEKTTVTLLVAAADKDDDRLTYVWSSSTGSLSDTTGDRVVWTAPDFAATCTLSVECNDGTTTVDTSMVVRVKGEEPASPAARTGPMLILDTLNRRIVLFGGGAGTGNYFNDVWEIRLDGNREWHRIEPAGTPPSPRFEASMIYDPVKQRMVVAAGSDGGTYFNDVWTLNLVSGAERWQEQTPTGTPPAPRSHACEAYCPPRRSLVLYGGQRGSYIYDDAWELQLDSMVWHELSPSGPGPGPRSLSVGAYDRVSSSMVLFGGYDGDKFWNDVWALTLTPGQEAWAQCQNSGETPSARGAPASGYDARTRRLFVCCGWDYPAMYDDLYSLNLGTGTWSQLFPADTMPSVRRGPAGVYDPYGHNLVVFGGDDYGIFRGDCYFIQVGK